MKKLTVAVVLLLLTGISTLSQTPRYRTYGENLYGTNRITYYPTYRYSKQTNSVTYYPTYPTTPPSPQIKRPSLAIVIVWRGSLVNELTINATPGERYNLESSTDLKKWVEIEKVSIGLSGQRVVRVVFDHSAHRFFRLTK